MERLEIFPQSFSPLEMDLTALPFEAQVKFLLGLHPKDRAYCTTSQRANEICQSTWFDRLQKGLRDFGYPPSTLCQQSPYWQYRFAGSLAGHESLIGRLDLARSYLEEEGVDDEMAVYSAIVSDDIETLRFLEPEIRRLKAEEGVYHQDDPFFRWLWNKPFCTCSRLIQTIFTPMIWVF